MTAAETALGMQTLASALTAAWVVAREVGSENGNGNGNETEMRMLIGARRSQETARSIEVVRRIAIVRRIGIEIAIVTEIGIGIGIDTVAKMVSLTSGRPSRTSAAART